MMRGTPVRHPELGKGVVVAALSRGGISGARVDFGYMVDWVPETDLTPDGDAAARPPKHESARPESARNEGPATRWRPLPSLTEDAVRARRAVLALKLGQVLQDDIADLSVGTGEAEAVLAKAVEDAATRKPASILVRGPYGAGKTHILTLLAALAARERFAAAAVILDGETVRLSDPMSLLDPFLRSLRFPDEAAPSGPGRRLADLRKRGERWDGSGRRRSRIAEAVFQMEAADFDAPEVLEALEDYLTTSSAALHASYRLRKLVGRSVHLPSMKAQRLDDRPQRFRELLADWTAFCVAAGARGLVLIFDEADVEYASTLRRDVYRWRREMFLDALNDLLLESIPLVVAFGSAPDTDGEAGNDAARDLAEHMPGILTIEAPQPAPEGLQALGRRLCGLYSRAYPDRMSGVERKFMESAIDERVAEHADLLDPAPRKFVRGLLEWLDVAPDLASPDAGDA